MKRRPFQLSPRPFGVGVSSQPDTRLALHEALDASGATPDALTLVFCAAGHDPNIVAQILSQRTGSHGVAVSTEGELSDLGFTFGHIVALHMSEVRAAIEVIPQLSQLSLLPLPRLPDTLARQLDRRSEDLDPQRHAWVLMADGTTRREPLLTSYFSRVAPKLGLVGGSFGNGIYTQHSTCERAWCVHTGRIYHDAALLLLLESSRPFHIFHHTHHLLTERRVTATAVSEDGYKIFELDGQPAAHVYASLRENITQDLKLSMTWSHPLGTRFKGKPFPISIIDVEGTTLGLAAPIHQGARLCLLTPGPMVESARDAIQGALDKLPHPASGALLFHCAGRYLAALHQGVEDALGQALSTLPIAGFNTTSEQFGPMHMNHSITGIAF